MSNLIPFDDFGITERKGIPVVSSRKGCVYIIESDNCIKIGRTKNPNVRIKAIQSTSGRIFKRIALTEPCNNYCKIECDMHSRFKTKRLKGEWFDISFDDAKSALDGFKLDLRDIICNPSEPSEILNEFQNAYMKNEMQKFLDERPLFRDYLLKNNFKLSFCKESEEIIVSDGGEIDMPLKLFIAIYKSGVDLCQA